MFQRAISDRIRIDIIGKQDVNLLDPIPLIRKVLRKRTGGHHITYHTINGNYEKTVNTHVHALASKIPLGKSLITIELLCSQCRTNIGSLDRRYRLHKEANILVLAICSVGIIEIECLSISDWSKRNVLQTNWKGHDRD